MAKRQPLPHELNGDAPPGCCLCCKCGRNMPARYKEDRDNDTIVRLNIPVYGLGCCSSDMLAKGDMENTPYLLANMGLSDEEWQRRIKALQKIKDNSGFVGDCWGITKKIIFGALFFFILPFWLPGFCKRRVERLDRWDEAMRKWQNDWNVEGLERLGIFVKTQSNCWVTYGGKGEKHRHYERWLAFSLTPNEKILLENEVHMMGDVENWENCCPQCGCQGPNENKLCWHPPPV